MNTLSRPVLYGAGLTALWAVLASANPSTTYHLAPLLVGVAVPGGIALAGPSGSKSVVAVAAAIGAFLALSATAILSAADRLTGPSLLPFGGAATEAVLFAVGGAVAGLAYGALTTPDVDRAS